MRRVLLALLAMTAVARAQNPIVAQPIGPPDGTAQAPAAPTPAPPAAPTPAPPAAPTPAPPAATPWLTKDTAQLQALDKVNSRASLLTVKVGDTAKFGSLTITVKACAIRPPDAPADATAFLIITDSNPKGNGFSGWMLKATPAVSMLAHPIYDVRVVGCL